MLPILLLAARLLSSGLLRLARGLTRRLTLRWLALSLLLRLISRQTRFWLLLLSLGAR